MKKNLKVIKFLLFLLSNKALVSFFRNRMLNQAEYNEDRGFWETMSFVFRWIKYRDNVFRAAFVFQDSKEGRDYWVRLSDKWVAIN